MAHKLKIKRKDGLGYWELPHMDEEYINELTFGGDTALHTHDQRYYTETEIDATWAAHLAAADPHSQYLLLDGTKAMTGDLAITKDQPGITFTDDGGLIGSMVLTDIGLEFHVDDADAVGSSAWDMWIDGGKIFSCNSAGFALWGYISIAGDYLQVAGDEGEDGYIYLYADQGDDPTSDFWRIRAGDDGLFAIQNWPVSGWEDRFILHPTTGITVDGLTMDGAIIIDSILDQDDFYSDSDTALATQQSIKAYCDTFLPLAGGEVTGNIILANNKYYAIKNTGGDAKNMVYLTASNIAYLSHADFATNVQGSTVTIRSNSTDALRLGASGLIDVANSACVLDEDSLSTDSATQLATQQSIKAYVDNKNYLDLGSILTSNGSYVGTKITVTVDDASTVFGNVLAQAADFNYDRADADAATSSVGLVLALSSGSGSKEVLIEGMACNTSWSWSAGLLYLSTATGGMTQTAPSGTGDQVVAVGWALSATCIYFKPSLVLVEVA